MSRHSSSSSLASQQRTAFINQFHKIAITVLDQLDHQTKNAPEDGRALPGKKGWIGLKMKVTVEHKAFECLVAYTYTADRVCWKEFFWDDISPSELSNNL